MVGTTSTVTTPTRAGPMSVTNLQEIYDTILSASRQPLPDVAPTPPDINEEEENDDSYRGPFLGRSELNYCIFYINVILGQCYTYRWLHGLVFAATSETCEQVKAHLVFEIYFLCSFTFVSFSFRFYYVW